MALVRLKSALPTEGWVKQGLERLQSYWKASKDGPMALVRLKTAFPTEGWEKQGWERLQKYWKASQDGPMALVMLKTAFPTEGCENVEKHGLHFFKCAGTSSPSLKYACVAL